MSKHATGAIVTAQQEIEVLRNALATKRLDGHDEALLIKRVARRLEYACWCTVGTCCRPHNKHVSPHENCILR